MMEIKLLERPKKPIIIEGFPGLGLIGTISTEYLIKHLSAKSIGYMWSKQLPPIAAIHEGMVVQPLEIFYAPKENIIIVHALSDIRGMEWEIAEALAQLYKDLNAAEIVCIEGILSRETTDKTYYYTAESALRKKFEKARIEPLKEGIIMGVTAALLLKQRGVPTSGIFVESHTKLPDSRAAAKIIEVLDKYLGLKVDYKPLIKAAAEFEEKLKTLLEQSKKTVDFKEARSLHPLQQPHQTYIG